METAAALDIAARLEKYIVGSFRGLFDQKSNVNFGNQLMVFSVKDMQEELRPIAMYVILDFIWTRIKKDLKKRILVVDEAWYFMQNEDSARFLYSMAKRARKYWLGVTAITQDVEDFLASDYGKAVVSNSSIQFLMKQASVSIPALTQTFHLSQGEQQLLMAADVGEGVFFAGQNHVALKVIASDEEHEVITTNPQDVARRQQGSGGSSGSGGSGGQITTGSPTPLYQAQVQAQVPVTMQGQTVTQMQAQGITQTPAVAPPMTGQLFAQQQPQQASTAQTNPNDPIFQYQPPR
jgi:hypothetical protein